MNHLHIREAMPEDAKKILCYLNQIGGESDNLLFGLNEFNLPLEKEKEFLQAMKEADKSIMLLGEVEDEIIAIASIQGFTRKRIEHRGNLAISVMKKYWHQGVGTKMMQELIAFAQSAGITVLELEVKAENQNAIALYEKVGFEKIGLYKKFFKINDVYYDSYLMNLYL